MIDRVISISGREVLFVGAGILFGCVLRWPTETHAAAPAQAEAARASAHSAAGPTCGNWVLATDQSGNRGQFDTFLLNVETGELFRTSNVGKEMWQVSVPKK